MSQRIKIYLGAGILAPVIYFCFVLIGGFLRPDYVAFSHTISTLVQANAQNRMLLETGFTISNIFLMLFGYGIFYLGRKEAKKYKVFSGLALIGAGIAGILIIIFPKDPESIKMSMTGFIHHFFIAILAIFTIISTLYFESGENHNRKLRIYSKISLIFILFFAILTVISGLFGYYYTGLLERISVGFYLQWVMVTAIVTLRSITKVKARSTKQ